VKKVRDYAAVPPGGMCRYVDPDDPSHHVEHPYYIWCKAKAAEGRIKRGLPIPYNWDEWFDEQLCKATPSACYEVPDVPKEPGKNWAELAVQFTASLGWWILNGAPLVSWEGFKKRHTQCAGDENTPRCPEFSTFAGTGLAKCGKCGCSTVKLFMETERCPLNKW
jgi:hypothetical protein